MSLLCIVICCDGRIQDSAAAWALSVLKHVGLVAGETYATACCFIFLIPCAFPDFCLLLLSEGGGIILAFRPVCFALGAAALKSRQMCCVPSASLQTRSSRRV